MVVDNSSESIGHKLRMPSVPAVSWHHHAVTSLAEGLPLRTLSAAVVVNYM